MQHFWTNLVALYNSVGFGIGLLMGLSVVMLVVALYKISAAQNERVTLGFGMALIAVGLVAPLFLPDISPGYDIRQDQFMKNTFLLFAGVGGNLVAASVFIRGRPATP